ncbi:MAG: hypothetical protein ACQERZ_09805 [Fusobacteriota bacterium]
MKKLWCLILIVFSVIGCSSIGSKELIKEQKVKEKPRRREVTRQKTLKEEQSSWKELFNLKNDKIKDAYYRKSNFYFNNEFITNENKEKYFSKIFKIKDELISKEILDKDDYDKTKVIEKGFYNIGNRKFYYINVWENIRRKWYLSFQLLNEIHAENIEFENLEESRNRYTELGITDNLKGFIYNVFDTNGAYFHNDEYIIGVKNIYQRFNENMAGSERFEMEFENENIEIISNDILVDYGNYFVDGDKGKYFFIWKRQEDNFWKIYLDLCIF